MRLVTDLPTIPGGHRFHEEHDFCVLCGAAAQDVASGEELTDCYGHPALGAKRMLPRRSKQYHDMMDGVTV